MGWHAPHKAKYVFKAHNLLVGEEEKMGRNWCDLEM